MLKNNGHREGGPMRPNEFLWEHRKTITEKMSGAPVTTM